MRPKTVCFGIEVEIAVSEGWDFKLIPEIEITGNAEQGILWFFKGCEEVRAKNVLRR